MSRLLESLILALAASGPALAADDPGTRALPLPHRFGGANARRIFVQHGLSPDASTGVPVDAASQVEVARRAGLRLLRVFLGQEDWIPWERPPASYGLEGPIGSFHDEALEGVDRLLPACLGDPLDPFDDVRLCVVLFNHGMSSSQPEDLYFRRYGELGFYRDPSARADFRRRIAHVLGHRVQGTGTPLDGTAWRDLDLIAVWEPMNEPGVHTTDDRRRTTTHDLASWLGEMALTLKALDPDGTLVASGTTGFSRYYPSHFWPTDFGDDVPSLVRVGGPGGLPGVDIYCLHFYGSTFPVSKGLGTWIDDARRALPAGARLWVEEFGLTRGAREGDRRAYDPRPSGTLGLLARKRVPWLFWEMGIIPDSPGDWGRYTWDRREWSEIEGAALACQERIADFDGALDVTPLRYEGGPLAAAQVPDGGSGSCLELAMTGDHEEVELRLPRPVDVRGGAICFRARALDAAGSPVGALAIEVQLKDSAGRYTLSNPRIQVSGDWAWYQLPLDGFQANGFRAADLRTMGLWFKEGSAAGVRLRLDDLRVW